MKTKGIFYLLAFLPAILQFSCKDENDDTLPDESSFSVLCPAVGPDTLLPARFTCDSLGISPPLSWSNFPANTACFALLMHHVASPTDIHYYWIVYNISTGINELEENASGFGTFGINSVNGRNEYAPPCSQGPGRKDYIITVYALSSQVEMPVPAGEVDMEVFLKSIENITLKSASMTVWYSRNAD